MNLKKSLCVGLAALMLIPTMASCSKKDDTSTNKKKKENVDATVNYNREIQDLGGYEFHVLNVENKFWNMNTDFAPESYDGTTINQVVFDRNAEIEAVYNCAITESTLGDYTNGNGDALTDNLKIKVESNDCEFDAAYVEGSSVGTTLINNGVVNNLYDFDEIQLDQSWWSQLVKNSCTLGEGKYKRLYIEQSNMSLTAFDLTWCLCFDKDAYTKKNIKDDMFQLVRDKKWTVEKFAEIAAKGANLNGDENFTYSATGKATYGVTGYWNFAKASLIGAGMEFLQEGSSGDPELASFDTLDDSVVTAVADIFGTDGLFTYGTDAGNANGSAGDYKEIFKQKRALFVGAEVKSVVSDFKDFDGNFGILPIPTYSEGDEIRSWTNYLAPVLVLPKNTKDVHKAAYLMDVMSFYSDEKVLPTYYETVLRGRGAKDPDSYEMLEVINQSRYFDAGFAYGWTTQFVEKLCSKASGILGGKNGLTTYAAEYKTQVSTAVKDTMEAIYE